MNGGSYNNGAAAEDGPVEVRHPQALPIKRDVANPDDSGYNSPFAALRVAKLREARCADAHPAL